MLAKGRCPLLEGRATRPDATRGMTALFFLDETTALAAGHRPCAYCRRSDFLYFAEGWRRAHRLVERPRAAFIEPNYMPRGSIRARAGS